MEPTRDDVCLVGLAANNCALPRTALEPVCERLATVIQARRVASGLSLTQLAAWTRLSRQMLSFIETNRRVPTIDQREDTDVVSMATVQDALMGVAGDEVYGDDCELYEQMGRKCTSEYSSGLSRKKQAQPEKQ